MIGVTNKNPARRAFEKLVKLANELDISIEFDYYQTYIIHKGEEFELVDTDGIVFENKRFPPEDDFCMLDEIRSLY